MSLEYLTGNRKYSLSYPELQETFERFHRMSDESFLNSLAGALHFACVVSFLKETPGTVLTSDEGLIHQLVHLLDARTREETLPRLREIRELFNTLCRLV